MRKILFSRVPVNQGVINQTLSFEIIIFTSHFCLAGVHMLASLVRVTITCACLCSDLLRCLNIKFDSIEVINILVNN